MIAATIATLSLKLQQIRLLQVVVIRLFRKVLHLSVMKHLLVLAPSNLYLFQIM